MTMQATKEKELTFEEIMTIEPKLRSLYEEAKHHPMRKGYCPTMTWYREYKPRLVRLVGWSAKKEELRSHTAYDTAYEAISEALPVKCPSGCRGCD